jgi:hypothetical protein
VSIAAPVDVLAVNQRQGTVTLDQIQSWIDMREGNLFLLLRLAGVVTPLEQATTPPELWETLRLAETYGAAATLEGAPLVGESPDQKAASSNYYDAQYQRIYTNLAALTRDDFARMGCVMQTNTPPTVAVPTLFGVVQNSIATEAQPWWHTYPYRLGRDSS